MKILWCSIDRSMRVATHFDAFQNAVSTIAEVTHIKRKLPCLPGQYTKWLCERGKLMMPSSLTDAAWTNISEWDLNEFDFVMCDAIFAFAYDKWYKVKIPKGVLVEDLHGSAKIQVQLAVKHRFDVIFHRYRDPFKKMYPKVWKNGQEKVWLPHSVNTSAFRDYGLEKDIGVFLPGMITKKYYPLRNKIHHLLKDEPYYLRIERPSETIDKVPKYPVREDYARLINRSKMTITTGATVDYAVMKFFEIPLCNSMLVSNWFPELADLGFVRGTNMMPFETSEECGRIVKHFVYQNIDGIKKITEEGRKLIESRHTTDIRAQEFLDAVRNR